LDGPRTAVVSCATVAVDTTQAARASRTGTATPGEALGLMTTVKGGATANAFAQLVFVFYTISSSGFFLLTEKYAANELTISENARSTTDDLIQREPPCTQFLNRGSNVVAIQIVNSTGE